MTTAYPGGLDAFTNPTGADNLGTASVTHASQHANANDAIEAIEAELGVLPKGSSASVRARLDALDVTVAAAVADAEAAADRADDAAALVGAPADAAIAAAIGGTGQTKTALRDYLAESNPAQMALDLARMDSVVRGDGLNAFVRRLPNNVYEVGYQCEDRRMIVHTLAIYGSAPGGATYQTLNQLQAVQARRLMSPRDDTTMTLTGAGWATNTSARAYGGSYRRNTTTGQTAAFTTPAGATMLGLIAGTLNNAGASKVTIVDNLAAAVTANKLPTAQEEVDAGRLASTVLVANGGTLDPADRILNQYSTGTTYYDGYVPLADGLDTTKTYTVTLTITGYKTTASTDFRLYASGWAVDGPDASTGMVLGSGVDPSIYVVEEELGVTGSSFSAHEFALFVNPAAGGWETVGSVHGYEKQISLAITVDGSVKAAMGTAEWFLGRAVSIVRTSELYHPFAVGKIADCVVAYQSTGADGLRLNHKITWAQAGQASFAYTLMWPYTATWTRGAFAGWDVDGTVNLADGSRFNAGRSNAMVAWGPSSSYAGFCSWDLPLVGNYASAPNSVNQIEDRTGGAIKKLYVARNAIASQPVGDPIVSYLAGDVWTGRRVYRIARMPGAEGILGRVS